MRKHVTEDDVALVSCWQEKNWEGI